jgi:uncharacterized phage protein (TIGR02216 family)
MRMRPCDFWAMTITEWNAAVAGFNAAHGITAPLARADLETLMRDYPDTQHE